MTPEQAEIAFSKEIGRNQLIMYCLGLMTGMVFAFVISFGYCLFVAHTL